MAPDLTPQERHPHLYTPDRKVDRRYGIRTVPMEVLNLSFPRTGTMCNAPPTLASPSSFCFLSFPT